MRKSRMVFDPLIGYQDKIALNEVNLLTNESQPYQQLPEIDISGSFSTLIWVLFFWDSGEGCSLHKLKKIISKILLKK